MESAVWWLALLNLFDAWATAQGMQAGVITEGNPWLAWLLAVSPPVAWAFKLLGVPALAWWIASQPGIRWTGAALRLLVGLYGVVALSHFRHLMM